MPIEADPSHSQFAVAMLADAVFLVSFWKPVFFVLPLAAWGWFVSKVMDKHAARFHLPRKPWNLIHLFVALIALFAGFFMPVPGIGGFFAGFAAMVVILAADIAIFASLHNKDERVPEGHKLRLDFSSMADAREAKRSAKEAGTVQLKIVTKDGKTAEIPEKETPEYEVRALAEDAMIKAVDARARLYEIAPAGEGVYAVSATIDGVRQIMEKIPAPNAVKIITFWKSSAGLDVQDMRRKQIA